MLKALKVKVYLSKFLNPKKIIFATIFSLLASFAYSADKPLTVALSFEQRTPVARPYDNLLVSGLNLPYGGKKKKDIINKLIPFKDGDINGIIWKITTVSGKNIDGGSWASWRLRIPDDTAKYIKGICFKVESSRDIPIKIKLFSGVSSTKIFRRSKPIRGTLKRNLKRGKNIINIFWEEFKNAKNLKSPINGLGFNVWQMPLKIKVNKIYYLFKNKNALTRYNAEKQASLRKRLKTMLSWMNERGIKLQQFFDKKKIDELQQLAWLGVDMLAMREQIDVWSRLLDFNEIKNDRKRLDSKWKKAKNILEQGDAKTAKIFVSKLRISVDKLVDKGIAEIPEEKRKFYYDETDKRFHRPDGRPYRVFAPHFFRSQYSEGRVVPEMLWRPWDLRYLCGMGFNGLRMQIKWCWLEPKQGKFNMRYFAMLKKIIKKAERFGLGVDIDFHWGWPSWFKKGKPGYAALKGAHKSNLYHWPEAVFTAWDKLGSELAALPNIVAFEVPGNETPIGKTKHGIKAYPYLMHLWNQWLKDSYKTRENLKQAWNSSSKYAERYTLKDNENFADNSIQPLGFQGDSSPEEAYAYNPRIYDHLRWTAWMQRYFSTEIIKILRKYRPGAVGMIQRTIGGKFDKSTVPLDYMYIQTCAGPGTLPGTHYQMGTRHAAAAATISLASFDSEQWMENGSKMVEAHVKLGLGFCPFAFHKRGGGGMLFVDDDWYLKDSVAYLPKKAKWIKSYWPPKRKTTKRIALIWNSKLAATTGDILFRLLRIIRKNYPAYKLEIYESMRIVHEPGLIKGCDAVISSSDYLPPRLLDILVRKFKGKVLLAGRLDVDAYVKKLGQQLVKHKLFVKSPDIATYSSDICGTVDLKTSWKWFFAGKEINPMKIPSPQKQKWSWMKVPGKWGELNITGSRKFAIGYAWYWKSVIIPETWKGRKLFIRFGAIDDLDWTFINGKLVGHIGENVRSYWMKKRHYRIPPKLIKFGQKNDIMLCVRNIAGDAGISSPAELFALQSIKLKWLTGINTNKKFKFTLAVNSARIALSKLRPEVKLIAELIEPDNKKFAAFIRQGRFWWWIGRRNWNVGPGKLAINEFLKSLNAKEKK